MIAKTSVNAFHSLQHVTTQSDRIYDYVVDHGSATIAMIAKGLGMEKSTVSARVNSLVHGDKKHEPRLEFSHLGKCPITHVLVKFWRMIEQYETAETIQSMFGFDDGTKVNVID